MLKRLLSLSLAICIVFSCFIATDKIFVKTDAATSDYGLTDNVQDGQILQCWNWSFNNIKNNMAKIADQGFSAIQTSPIQASKESTKESWSTAGNAFWVYYQPINFSIETNSRSALGTKSEFKAMCDEAEKYGIKVIVDTVFNHLANANSDNSLNSQIPSDIRDDSSCWHNIYTNISNYSDRYDITHRCLAGLPDLNTGSSKIQNYAIGFLKECIDAGADGFRFDAAKHIETPSDYSGTSSDFWPNVINAATSYSQSTYGTTPYFYGEMLDNTGGVDISAYTKYMSVTDNGGSNSIRNAVNSSNAGSAANSYIFNGAQPKYTVQWNESHDTYAEGSSNYVSDTALKKTWALVGSRAEVCGLYLARPNSSSTKLGSADTTAWADKEVKAINRFKNAFVGETEYFASSGSIAYNERGTSGVVLVNVSGGSASVNVVANRMASGTYKDAITGNTFTVSNSKIIGNIGSTGIAVVYDESKINNDTVVSTESSTSETLSGEKRTVNIGVIEYITDTLTLHYWNNTGLEGDATLKATGKTAKYAVGSSYWSNAEQTFNIYTAEVPVEATSMKTYTAADNSNWAQEEVQCSEDNITLVFEWGGTYHNVSAIYTEETVESSEETVESSEETVESSEAETEESSEEETIESTEESSEVETESSSTSDSAGYYLVGTLNGENYWYVDDNSTDRKLKFNETDNQYTLDWEFFDGDSIKVVHYDGTSITRWYNSSGDNYSIGSSKKGEGTIYFRPDGNSDWSYYYFTVQPKTVDETESTEEETESTEEETEATEVQKPVKVENIVATPSSSTAVLSWDAVEGATKYWVYKNVSGSYVIYSSASTNKLTVASLLGDTTYQFKVVAVLSDGTTQKLADADVVEFTTLAPIVTKNIETVSSVTSITLSWDKVEGAQKYWIYKAFEENGPFYVYDATTDLEYSVKALQPDTTYYFKVVPAVLTNGKLYLGETGAAQKIEATTSSGESIKVKVTDLTSTSATISWNAFENAEKYWIIYSTETMSTTDLSKWTTWSETTDTSFTIKWRKPGEFYHFSVVAKCKNPETGGTETVNYLADSARIPYSDSDIITFTPVDDDTVTLSWNDDIGMSKVWVSYINAEG
ncbi:MAG: hypothetical protein IKB73_04220, partial [Ruminococcus sp.]|nr:hypothetical protein [Ruminococcus sp.]